jgi:type I restriction enzyme R subunit
VAKAAVSPNFAFLAAIEPSLVQLAARAERYVFDDPVVSLVKTRQFGEVLAQQVAAHTGMYASPAEQQSDLLRRLRDRRVIAGEVEDFFHSIRVAGNKAVHENYGNQRDALRQLRMAWSLAVWFRRAFKDRGFKPGPFVPPPDPVDVDQATAAELDQLRASLAEYAAKAEHLAATADALAQQRAAAEEAAQVAYADLEIALDLAQETEAQAAADKAQLEAQLAALQAAAEAAPQPETEAVQQQVQHAGEHFLDDEATTRLAIDVQLRAAGWDADSAAISYKAGARPTKGRDLAIAEWPTKSGPVDYVLFAGLTPVAVVEAKRRAKDVAGALDQSKRYARDYAFRDGELSPGGPWGAFAIPFLFATNGRGFIQQLRTKSGIWFLDARRPTNLPRPLNGWYSPDDLTALLAQDIAAADHKLATEPASYLPLRDYQLAAIAAVESAIAAGRPNMLLAMATGTGKTRLALCLIYRLLKAGRFRRVLFLVDRTALGEQAHNAFKDVRLDQLQPLTEIYDVKGLGDLRPDPDTRLHVATVQGMVHRLLNPDGDTPPPAVGAYDCILIDECHRGYSLDREMTDGELEYRSEAEYISKYRRVLDHFDATRIGLTATPALHTTEIFGEPIYRYTYPQAVIDGYLVDHEPPIRVLTKLNQQGIHWEIGESVNVYDPGTGQLQLFETPDEIDIEVDGFNTKVVTEPFNRVICQALAAEIDPTLPGKTMIFCATDAHADMVVDLLKQAFAETYGAVEDAAVQKITGATDKPLEHLRRFKNERLPSVAVTVDLLTTGIDVPAITNLVFIRRVRSRILYDQMMGRATRLCPDLYAPGADKEVFRIYDAVDLYSALLPYSAMKPVVTRPNITFDQLATELLTLPDDAHKHEVLDELIAKLQRKKRSLKGEPAEASRPSPASPPTPSSPAEVPRPPQSGRLLHQTPRHLLIPRRRHPRRPQARPGQRPPRRAARHRGRLRHRHQTRGLPRRLQSLHRAKPKRPRRLAPGHPTSPRPHPQPTARATPQARRRRLPRGERPQSRRPAKQPRHRRLDHRLHPPASPRLPARPLRPARRPRPVARPGPTTLDHPPTPMAGAHRQAAQSRTHRRPRSPRPRPIPSRGRLHPDQQSLRRPPRPAPQHAPRRTLEGHRLTRPIRPRRRWTPSQTPQSLNRPPESPEGSSLDDHHPRHRRAALESLSHAAR